MTSNNNSRFVYRSVFISDLHLGAAGCKAEAVYRFLHSFDCDRLYLVGDIIDGWVGSNEGKWKQSHLNVLRTILDKSQQGTSVMYAPGNHDAFLRRLHGVELGNTLIDDSFEHFTLDGKRLLVVHGDLFDSSVTKHHRMAYMGAWGYEYMTMLNLRVNTRRVRRDRPPVDFCSILKRTCKRIVKRGSSYEEALANHARELGYNGVVCGHVHRPALVETATGVYVNTGDWVEHCTAVVEHIDGQLELIWWKDFIQKLDGLERATARRELSLPSEP